MVIPMHSMQVFPPGPPPPAVADKLRPLGWCMCVVVVLCMGRLFLRESFLSVMGDAFMVFAVLALLRDDNSCFGTCGNALCAPTAGYCQTGLPCLVTVLLLCGLNSCFDGWKAVQLGMVYNNYCLSADSSRDGAASIRYLRDDAPAPVGWGEAASNVSHANHNSAAVDSQRSHFGSPIEGSETAVQKAAHLQETTLCPTTGMMLAVLAVQVVMQMIMTCIALGALKAAQSSMASGLNDPDSYGNEQPGGFGGAGFGYAEPGYVPDDPHGMDDAQMQAALAASLGADVQDGWGGMTNDADADEAALQAALAASEADDQAALQAALAASAAETQGASAPDAADEGLQQALRQSLDDARRDGAAQ